jgi:catechol 2,3-dioxygenase-like lactoylglutathione lyase family enzyme
MPEITGVLETSLYVDDVARSKRYYAETFGFQPLVADARFCALSVAGRHVLLLFKKGASTEPMPIPGGVIPPHDGSGEQHLAFAIPASELAAWERRLAGSIESTVTWPRGGTSLYFRDPDHHLIELVTPGCWAIY